jgi:hypothetical protein
MMKTLTRRHRMRASRMRLQLLFGEVVIKPELLCLFVVP